MTSQFHCLVVHHISADICRRNCLKTKANTLGLVSPVTFTVVQECVNTFKLSKLQESRS
jgi:hypothetical protein